jgi:hypothetical protein
VSLNIPNDALSDTDKSARIENIGAGTYVDLYLGGGANG